MKYSFFKMLKILISEGNDRRILYRLVAALCYLRFHPVMIGKQGNLKMPVGSLINNILRPECIYQSILAFSSTSLFSSFSRVNI